MVLDENNCEEIIASYAYEDWEPLLALIPRIESMDKFGEYKQPKQNVAKVGAIPYYIPVDIVYQFSEIVCSMPIMIAFDWVKWDEGRKIARDKNFDFDSTNLTTKCKLITAIIRNNRFCEGALVSAFESGLILKILKSIEKEVCP